MKKTGLKELIDLHDFLTHNGDSKKTHRHVLKKLVQLAEKQPELFTSPDKYLAAILTKLLTFRYQINKVEQRLTANQVYLKYKPVSQQPVNHT